MKGGSKYRPLFLGAKPPGIAYVVSLHPDQCYKDCAYCMSAAIRSDKLE